LKSTRIPLLIALGVLCAAVVIVLILTQQSGSPAASAAASLRLNEVMASNKGAVPDENGEYPDWVEIQNLTDTALDISGYGLTDDMLVAAKWVFPSGTVIEPNGYLVVYCSGSAKSEPLHAAFKLKTGDELVLSNSTGKAIDSISIQGVSSNATLGRDPDDPAQWIELTSPSPGYPNTQQGMDAYHASLTQTAESIGVVINEFMASNKTTIAGPDGLYPDWIELYNTTNAAVDLSGCGISDDENKPGKWRFPENTSIGAGEYLIVYCSGRESNAPGAIEIPFSLNSYAESVVLSNTAGKILDSFAYTSQDTDHAMARTPDGTGEFAPTAQPTPGYPNTQEGVAQFALTSTMGKSGLILSEVMSANYSYFKDKTGEYPDWVEVTNVSGETIDLSGYALSNNPKNPGKWRFAEGTSLAPNEQIVVLATGNTGEPAQKKNPEANFRISADGEVVLLYAPDGTLLDKLSLAQSRADVSYGRANSGELLYYDEPTPGSPNSAGFAGYAKKPEFSLLSGAYKGEQQVTIAVPDNTTVTYTLDGTEPTANSKSYQSGQTIAVSKTSVLRARAFENGMGASDIATVTYLIDSPHTLPVVSLVTEPDNLWDEETGIYAMGSKVAPDAVYPFTGANFWNEWERPVHFDLIGEDGVLEHEQDAIFRIFGAYSRGKEQKAFALVTRAGYGPSSIDYPVFDDRPFDSYQSLVLRASGQDSTITRMRDIVTTSLVGDSTDLTVQAYRQCVVYLNGEYWGVYNLREKINKHYLAQHYGIADPETIDILVGNGAVVSGSNEDYKAMVAWADSHDLSKKENYDYMCSLMDVENFATYCAMQIYVNNTDTGNIKFWRSESLDNKWRWLTYDFCWGMMGGQYISRNGLEQYTNAKGHGVGDMFSTVLIRSLLKNDEFEEIFLNACAKMVNEVFTPEKVRARVDECQAAIDEEMKRDTELWSEMSYEGWKRSVERIREFGDGRPETFIQQTKDYFHLSDAETEALFG